MFCPNLGDVRDKNIIRAHECVRVKSSSEITAFIPFFWLTVRPIYLDG